MNTQNEPPARARLEAYALARVMTLAEDDRLDACCKLEAAALALRAWLGAVRRELTNAPKAELPALWAILNRAGMERDRAELEAAGVDLDKLLGLDPATARKAYADTLADTARAGVLACVETAENLLTQVKTAKDETDRRALVLDAVRELTRPQAEGDAPLADAWQTHLDRMAAPEAGPDEVLRLQSCRGAWGDWINDNLGTRGGLEAGQTLVVGAAPEGGKSTFAALLAVDALAMKCPVVFWQLELSREETLEHMQAQRPDLDGWPTVDFWTRWRQPLPAAWADLLTMPRWPEPTAEAVQEALVNMAHQTARARRAGKPRHKINGLVIVDYMQLLTTADKTARESRFEILEKAASRLAKAAAENGACLLLCSQLNKQDQKDGATDGTALAGADLARMGCRVAMIHKADADGKPCGAGDKVDWQPNKGEARLMTWTKGRGVRYTPDGSRPKRDKVFWTGGRGRGLHGGDVAARKGGLSYE